MLPQVYRLRVVILHPRGGERIVAILTSDFVNDVIARVLAESGIELDAYPAWELCFAGDPLPGDRPLLGLIPLGPIPTPVSLRPAQSTELIPGMATLPPGPLPAAGPGSSNETDFDILLPEPKSAREMPPQVDTDLESEEVGEEDFDDEDEDEDLDDEEFDDEDADEEVGDSEFELTLDEGPKSEPATGTILVPTLAPGAAMPPPAAPAPVSAAEVRSRSAGAVPHRAKAAARTESRRATVRYYSRMNPERVFPLLVMLTRDEVEKVVKRHVEQKATGPLKIAKDVPLEIEPVLPGCVCHPPRVTTKVGAGDEVFTFHVVPHVLGKVTGARVLLRQDHAPLAEIELDIRVVQRTMVVVSGLSAFVLPAASAAMKHFNLDFTPKDGSNPYLAALNFLFGEVSPVALTAALVAVTGMLWWFTRPKGRDVFWDITTKPPGGKPGGAPA